MKLQENHSIKRIHNPSQSEFLELWKQYQPFIINGVAENWNAYQKWANNYLVEVCGNNTVPVETYGQDFFEDYNYACQDYCHTKEMKFKEYIDVINGNNKDNHLSYYLAQVDFNKKFPQLNKDIVYPEYLSRKAKIVYLFFGFANKTSASSTCLHFDDAHNIFVQIRGRKRLLLFPPTDYLSFYPPLEDNKYSPTCSKVNPNNSDLESFPKFPWQEKKEVILEAGEILYIPPLWWHHVTAIDENISLTFWYPVNIKDFFSQKELFSVVRQIAPRVIPRLISSQITRWLKSKSN